MTASRRSSVALVAAGVGIVALLLHASNTFEGPADAAAPGPPVEPESSSTLRFGAPIVQRGSSATRPSGPAPLDARAGIAPPGTSIEGLRASWRRLAESGASCSQALSFCVEVVARLLETRGVEGTRLELSGLEPGRYTRPGATPIFRQRGDRLTLFQADHLEFPALRHLEDRVRAGPAADVDDPWLAVDGLSAEVEGWLLELEAVR